MIKKTGLYVSPLLTNISLAYKNDEYVAEQIMPIVPVKKDTAQITTYGMDNLRITNAIRAQGANTNEVNHTVSIGAHYVLQEHALKELVTMEEIDNADTPIKPKIDATENIVDRMLVIKEKLLADVMADTAVMTSNTTLAGTDQWSDYVNSDPLSDLLTGITAVRTSTGKKPNTMIFPYGTWMVLLQHPDMTDRIKVGEVNAESVKGVILRAFPGIKNIIIADAQYNSAVEGGTDTLAEIWGSHAWVGYIEKKPSLKSRSFGFTYQNKQHRLVDEDPMSKGGEAWDRKGDFVRVTDKYDQKLVDVTCLYLIKDAIA